MPAHGELILFTHEFAPFRGGAATYVQEIAAAAVTEGYAPEVWTADYRTRAGLNTAANKAPAAALSFPVARLPSNGRLTPAGLMGLMRGLWTRRKRLRDGGKGGARVVLLSVGAQMAWMPLWAAGVLPARGVTCFFHGSELLRFARQPLWRALARRFFARVDGFIVASRYVETLARESDLLPPGAEIRLAPCACPTMLQAAVTASSVAPGDVNAPHRILTVARLHPRKGQAELAKILALLPPELRERIIYQMVGTGTPEYIAQIEAACREGGIRHEILSGVPDEGLAPLYISCTIYAQASRALPQSIEGFGISFLEASLCGKAVAAYASGGIAEAVIDDKTGLLAPEGDTHALAAAIEKLLRDPALRSRLGEGGRRHAADFDWRRSARLLCDFALRTK